MVAAAVVPPPPSSPPFALERLVGLLLDVVGGDGGRELAPFLDCHRCRTPLRLHIDHIRRQVIAVCPREPQHLRWVAGYLRLPAWIEDYARLNREEPW